MMKLLMLALLVLVPQGGITQTSGGTPPKPQGEISRLELGNCPDGKKMNVECWIAASAAKRKANRDAAVTVAESMLTLLSINEKAIAACNGDEACIASANANYLSLSQAITLGYKVTKAANQAAFEAAALACCEDE